MGARMWMDCKMHVRSLTSDPPISHLWVLWGMSIFPLTGGGRRTADFAF